MTKAGILVVTPEATNFQSLPLTGRIDTSPLRVLVIQRPSGDTASRRRSFDEGSTIVSDFVVRSQRTTGGSLTPSSHALPAKKNVWSSRVLARMYLELEKVVIFSAVPESS